MSFVDLRVSSNFGVSNGKLGLIFCYQILLIKCLYGLVQAMAPTGPFIEPFWSLTVGI